MAGATCRRGCQAQRFGETILAPLCFSLFPQAGSLVKEKQERKTVPHFWNLNEDAELTGVVVHFVRSGKTKIGRAKQDPAPGIALSGLNIVKYTDCAHALINSFQ